MRKCLSCGAIDTLVNNTCSTCGAELNNDGCAPSLAQIDYGFKTSYFADLASFEERHFWFCARRKLIIWAFKIYCNNSGSFFEIGCGTGYVLSGIAAVFPEVKLYGSEVDAAGLAIASAKQSNIEFMQIDARHIPYIKEFDSIGAFDVLEHIKEDELVLEQMHAALKPHGVLLITVPQHAWLWSAVDDYSCHVRRYAAKDIHRKIETAGFEILRSTSFVSIFLPAMLTSRMLKKSTPANDVNAAAELRIPFWLNWLFESVMNIEIALIRAGINFSLGGSRLVVARKI